MRISDWSSDVCSSDLTSACSPGLWSRATPRWRRSACSWAGRTALRRRRWPPRRNGRARFMLPRLAALRIEARREIPRGLLYATPLLAVALTVLAGFLLLLAMGYDPGRALYHFFIAPLTSPIGLASCRDSVCASV